VWRAVVLMGLSVALNLVILSLDWRFNTARAAPLAIGIGEVIGIVLVAWLAWKIVTGRNWARITLLVLTVMTLPQVGIEVLNAAPRAAHVAGLKLIELGLDIGTVYLLFFPGREFFRKKAPAAD
jgi:hypothetical protein